MDKNAVLGELLYLISRYEKARVPTGLFWKKEYIDSLKKSLDIMIVLVNLLGRKQDVMSNEIKPIIEFFQEYSTIIVKANTNFTTLFSDNSINLKNYCDNYIDYRPIYCLMNQIVNECKHLLGERKRKYKRKIYYLLMAFHNLPRAYLNSKAKTIYNIQEKPISVEDAMQYSISYLKQKDLIS